MFPGNPFSFSNFSRPFLPMMKPMQFQPMQFQPMQMPFANAFPFFSWDFNPMQPTKFRPPCDCVYHQCRCCSDFGTDRVCLKISLGEVSGTGTPVAVTINDTTVIDEEINSNQPLHGMFDFKPVDVYFDKDTTMVPGKSFTGCANGSLAERNAPLGCFTITQYHASVSLQSYSKDPQNQAFHSFQSFHYSKMNGDKKPDEPSDETLDELSDDEYKIGRSHHNKKRPEDKKNKEESTKTPQQETTKPPVENNAPLNFQQTNELDNPMNYRDQIDALSNQPTVNNPSFNMPFNSELFSSINNENEEDEGIPNKRIAFNKDKYANPSKYRYDSNEH
ncbi:hypothetical protein SNEBB_009234 [Seison nebaliae]|nr:hypothetical protein SNEBB_009234 [Seison nebaliae]